MEDYERRLLARARELADVSDERDAVLICLGDARHCGLDAGALSGLVGCAVALGASSTDTYTAGRPHAAPGSFAGEHEFLALVAEIEEELETTLYVATRLGRDTDGALDHAGGELDEARDELAAARHRLAGAKAMPVYRPCDGCHRDRDARIREANAAIADAKQLIHGCETRIALCRKTLSILAELVTRLRWALPRIRAVPADLGETYEAVYRLIRRGGTLPCDGRWITGTGS